MKGRPRGSRRPARGVRECMARSIGETAARRKGVDT